MRLFELIQWSSGIWVPRPDRPLCLLFLGVGRWGRHFPLLAKVKLPSASVTGYPQNLCITLWTIGSCPDEFGGWHRKFIGLISFSPRTAQQGLELPITCTTTFTHRPARANGGISVHAALPVELDSLAMLDVIPQ
jgi:hypothetical protein